MLMGPNLRRFVLFAHVATSVGWLGAVAVFLALGIAAAAGGDPQTVRAIFLVMPAAGWAALVPLAALSLLTGLIQSMATAWGLVRHYWVLFKLLINIAGLAVLLAYMQTLTYLAGLAADPAFTTTALGDMRRSPMVHSLLALLLLVAATALAVYKPRGMTAYGQRKQQQRVRRSMHAGVMT
jgi:hypothetical protein